MLKFLRFIWKLITQVRIAIFNLFFLLIVIVIFIGIANTQQAPKSIADNTALLINPSGMLVDKKTYDASPIALLSASEQQDAETQVRDLVDAINLAAKDKRIQTLVLRLDHLYGGGLSKLEEVAQAIENFKGAGKEVIAYGNTFTQQQYFLASHANKVYLHNMGTVFLTGYGMYRNYLKDAADKLHIQFHVFRVGQFKDAIENFVRNDMSAESREHNTRWINELWQRYTQTVENSRALSTGAIENYILAMANANKNPIISNASLAKNAGLVDEVLSETEMRQRLIDLLGEEKPGIYQHIDFTQYLAKQNRPSLESNKNKIGLIVAQGTIVDGYAPETSIGAQSLASLIRKAQEQNLKALIIRVNSGGGSAFASEIIREHLVAAQNNGLPVYISMGSLAASGGYWLSAPATEIWATPTTITGSIGVWGLIPNITESLNKLGIHSDGIGTSALSDVFQPNRTMSDEAKQFYQRNVNSIYSRFISLVANARGQSEEQIHDIAQGRVWTGKMAKKLGLVDQLGSFQDLVDHIVKINNFDTYDLLEIERDLTPQEQIIRSLMQGNQSLLGSIKTALLGNQTLLSHTLTRLEKDPAIATLLSNKSETVYAQCIECLFVD